MAKSSVQLVQAIRQTARRLAKGDNYQWGHMGSCNCGHLAQTITSYNKGQIHGAAMWRHGDWREQLRDYCPQSGLPMDQIIDEMLAFGLSTDDLTQLERLTHPHVLASIPVEQRDLKHNVREDVVLYLMKWADVLEEELLSNIQLGNLAPPRRLPLQL